MTIGERREVTANDEGTRGRCPSPGRRLALLVAVVALGAGIWALASSGDGPREPRLAAPRLTATLDDERRTRPGGVLAWRTLWRLCWAPQAGASGYELQTWYGEGGAGPPRPARGRCHSIEVARGRNPARQGLRHRKVQIGLLAGQLAYRVRALQANGAAGAWSPTIAAGEPYR